ncbi:hypothetical protein KAR91_59150 [Candidatus Pacearchaeota archaeon]|nr:hypothetical protein [Candidatus Pacearchaeota archaeon]
MKIKKGDLLRLHNAITLLEGRQYSVKFSYGIAKNKVVIRDEITALEEARKSSEAFNEYENKRVTLAREYADKDENGSPKIQDNSFVLTTNKELFEKEFEELKDQYKDELVEREKQIKDFEELLEETVDDYEGMKINFKDIPENIDPTIMECFIIADLIIEE